MAMTAPPRSIEEILRTGEIDTTYAESTKNDLLVAGAEMDVAAIQKEVAAMLPQAKARLAASRPTKLAESEHYISLRDGYQSRLVVCHQTNAPPSGKAPLVLLFHGGGFCLGWPEFELPLARELALKLSAVVICPAYRLAPDYPFPCSINDAWDVTQWAASESFSPHSKILPPWTDAHSGFIVGGTSSGAGLSSVLAHLSRDNNLNPPITGQALIAGGFMSENHVPQKYKHLYLSWEQNADAPVLTRAGILNFRRALKPDESSPLFNAFDQHHPDDVPDEVAKGHVGLAPAYFQICGLDPSRDDGLIYESVLREESGVLTKIDLYAGLPHCWWVIHEDFESSKKRDQDALEGFRWLLVRGGVRDEAMPPSL